MPEPSNRNQRVDTTIPVRFTDAREFLVEYSSNISLGGVFVRTASPGALGTVVRLSLELPGTGQSIPVTGQVAFVLPPEQAARQGKVPGMGVRFARLDPAVQETLAAYVSSLQQQSKGRVLVVDDDVVQLQQLADLLRAKHLNVTTASSAVKALEIVRFGGIDFIISDINMPRMDGFEFRDNLRSNPRTGTIPFVFLTASDADADRKVAGELGVQYFLNKPVDEAPLLALLRQILGEAAFAAGAAGDAPAPKTNGAERQTLEIAYKKFVALGMDTRYTADERGVFGQLLLRSVTIQDPVTGAKLDRAGFYGVGADRAKPFWPRALGTLPMIAIGDLPTSAALEQALAQAFQKRMEQVRQSKKALDALQVASRYDSTALRIVGQVTAGGGPVTFSLRDPKTLFLESVKGQSAGALGPLSARLVDVGSARTAADVEAAIETACARLGARAPEEDITLRGVKRATGNGAAVRPVEQTPPNGTTPSKPPTASAPTPSKPPEMAKAQTPSRAPAIVPPVPPATPSRGSVIVPPAPPAPAAQTPSRAPVIVPPVPPAAAAPTPSRAPAAPATPSRPPAAAPAAPKTPSQPPISIAKTPSQPPVAAPPARTPSRPPAVITPPPPPAAAPTPSRPPAVITPPPPAAAEESADDIWPEEPPAPEPVAAAPVVAAPPVAAPPVVSPPPAHEPVDLSGAADSPLRGDPALEAPLWFAGATGEIPAAAAQAAMHDIERVASEVPPPPVPPAAVPLDAGTGVAESDSAGAGGWVDLGADTAEPTPLAESGSPSAPPAEAAPPVEAVELPLIPDPPAPAPRAFADEPRRPAPTTRMPPPPPREEDLSHLTPDELEARKWADDWTVDEQKAEPLWTIQPGESDVAAGRAPDFATASGRESVAPTVADAPASANGDASSAPSATGGGTPSAAGGGTPMVCGTCGSNYLLGDDLEDERLLLLCPACVAKAG